jgi:predicted metalloprotease with PDZ domain
MKKCLLLVLLTVFTITHNHAQQATVVEYDLGSLKDGTLAVKITPPAVTSDVIEFVIPQIIPGTYMKINYRRNYKDITFYDKQGKKMSFKKKNNRFIIRKASSLSHISYRVRQSSGSKRVWDNIVLSGGTIFKRDAFMINYQLITGYFKNYEHQPFEIKVTHPAHLYGATSQEAILRSPLMDVFKTTSYAELIDRPLIYSLPDTVSFESGGTRFHIAVHSDMRQVTADSLLKPIHKLIDSLYHFMGGFNMKDYHFLIFNQRTDSMSFFHRFAMNNALEHRHCFMLTSYDAKDMSNVTPYLNYFTAHEFLHTWAPLNIHSEKIDNFSFAKPDMSAHLWLYEGITDYLAGSFCRQYNFNFYEEMAYSFSFAESRKPRSFTESSRHIIKANMFNWLSKMLQLINGYERGKVVGFCLDMELIRLSKDTFKLRDLMERMNATYSLGKPFPDDSLFKVMAALSYPEIEGFLQKYVGGKELPPYKKDMEMLGWQYIGEDEKVASFGKIVYRWGDTEHKTILIKSAGKNTLGLRKNDIIPYPDYERAYKRLHTPEPGDTVAMRVKRGNDSLTVKGAATIKVKNNMARIVVLPDNEITPEQRHFRKIYYRKPEYQ